MAITRKELEDKAKEHGVANPVLFAKFIEQRFGMETHWSYIMEWIGRFKTGSPEMYMDSHSLATYNKLRKVC